MGDFNGHLQALDGFQDTNGELLLALARTLALDVLNLRPECEGQYTWSARNSRSCIDYVLATPALARRLTHMNIDEKVGVCGSRGEAFEQNFQPTEPPTYDQFVLELRRIMKKHEIRINSRGGLRRPKAGGTKRYKGPLLQDKRRIAYTERLLGHHPERSA
ncbi:hypothetical protein MRX96_009265 [Rhipicephalus microplus]